MSPTDDSPHAGEIMQPPERRIPQPLPGQESHDARGDELGDEADVGHRPPLPRHHERSAPDAQGDAAGPVMQHRRVRDDDGVKSVKKQRG